MYNAINWNADQMRLFRVMHKFMSEHQSDFTRPFSRPIDPLDWKVIARLASLYAAHNMVPGPTGETRPASLE